MKTPFTLLLLIATLSVSAATARNEFRLNQAGKLFCDSGAGSDVESSIQPCLHIGALHIGQSQIQVERLLGQADKQMQLSGVTYYAYAIEPFYEVQDFFPYWMISYQNGKVYTLQATGLAIPPNINFSSIRFGDEPPAVTEKLGMPTHSFNRRDNGYEVWQYKPYPISIEFKQHQVYSIRISAPAY